jgi:preprotein translocase subunit YajC
LSVVKLDPSILLLIVTAGLLVLLTMRGRRQHREQQLLQSRLIPDTEVMTSSGLFATVVSVDDTVVVLETGPGQQSRWDRRAVARVVAAPQTSTDADGSTAGEQGAAVGAGSDDTLREPSSAGGDDEVDPGNATGGGDDTGRSKES